jgi:hypothetical protein
MNFVKFNQNHKEYRELGSEITTNSNPLCTFRGGRINKANASPIKVLKHINQRRGHSEDLIRLISNIFTLLLFPQKAMLLDNCHGQRKLGVREVPIRTLA